MMLKTSVIVCALCCLGYVPPSAAEVVYLSPGVGYSGQFFDDEWRNGLATEVSGGVPGVGAFLHFDYYGEGRWRLGLGPQLSYPLGLEIGASLRSEADEFVWGLHTSPYVSIGVAHLGFRFLVEADRDVSTGVVAMAKGPIELVGSFIQGD